MAPEPLGILETPLPGVRAMVSAARLPVGIPELSKTGLDINIRQCMPNSSPAARITNMKSGIPLVDLMASHEELVAAIQNACEYGFFQVVNHGISANLIHQIHTKAEQYFGMVRAGKGQYSFDRAYVWSYRDNLKLFCSPPSAVSLESWPLQPTGFKENLMEYTACQKDLMEKLLEVMSESLDLEKGHILKDCGEPRMMLAINRYLAWLEPNSKFGIDEHSDPCTVTILSQDDVGGLQVYKEGVWVDVKLLEGALFVNVGDHLQILSNGKYQSCLHRVIANNKKVRLSTGFFLSPSVTASLKPAPALVNGELPPLFKEFVYGDFLENFYGMSEKSSLQ